MKVRIGGSFKDVASGKVRVSGAWKRLSCARYYDGSAWKSIGIFTPDLSASVSPALADATITGGGTATTNSVTVSVSGGQGPYSYAWTKTAGEGVARSPTSPATQFQTSLSAEDEGFGTFLCTVTDALGTTASVSVSASFSSISGA